MSMRVDPAGCDDKPVGIDVALSRPLFAAERGNAAVGDGDVAGECGLAGTVDDLAMTMSCMAAAP